MYPDRINTLQSLSNLTVKCHKDIEKGEVVYEFFLGEKCIKSCYTYPKAKLFAEGIRFGRLNFEKTNS